MQQPPEIPPPRRRAGRVLAALACGALAGCGDSDPPPHLVVFTLDTTRADHLPTYGYFRDTAPALDRLARESVVFERCLAPMSTTLPTHTSLFTGTWPLEHGVLANAHQGGARFVPAPGLRTFAKLARDRGYRTGAFVSATPLKRDSGIHNGFDEHDQPEGKQRDGALTVDQALAWIERMDERTDGGADEGPLFAWVHTYDAHWPFEPREEYARLFSGGPELEAWLAERAFPETAPRQQLDRLDEARVIANLYDAELRYQDDQMQRFLAAMDERFGEERVALLVVGDHGEGLCQHGRADHGSTWDEQLAVPLLMRVPGVAPRRVDTPLSVVDAIPTWLGLLELAGFEAFLDQASGQDALSPAFDPRPIVSQDTGREREGQDYRWALTTERWKYFRITDEEGAVREELYDLERDPYELEDRSAAEPEALDELRAALAELLTRQRERGVRLRGDAATTKAADPAILGELEALGYVDDAD